MFTKKKILWMAIDTDDPYVRPLYVCDSVEELMEKYKVTRNNVVSSIWHYYHNTVKGKKKTHCDKRFMCVEVDDDGDW